MRQLRSLASSIILLLLSFHVCFAGEASLSSCKSEKNNAKKIELCTIVIDGHPKRTTLISALNSRGVALQRLGKHQEAIDDFTHLIGLSPKVAAYHDSRQASYKALGNLHAALDDADAAVSIAPNAAFVRHSRASILLDMGRAQDAVADFRRAIEIDPTPTFRYFDLGRACIAAGDYAAAILALSVAIEKAPSWPAAYKHRAIAELKSSRSADALTDLEKALQLAPADPELAGLIRQLKPSSQSQQAEAATTAVDEKPPLSAKSERNRVALVIGNGAYKNAPTLPNPRNDAVAMSEMLSSLGFHVITAVDVDRAGMEASIRDFLNESSHADVSLFFYSGHGMEIGGINYLLPVDVKLEEPSAINFEAINATVVTDAMGGEDRVGIILLDACRNNPFTRSLKRSMVASRAASISDGLAPINSEGGGLMVGFATAPGDTASDGGGRNSPFTTALLKWMPAKGLELELVMKRVKAEVSAITKNDQRPWTNSDLTEDVYLAGDR